MEMVVNENAKIVEYWLRSDEAGLREQLKPEFVAWKRRGYLPAVYLSGSDDLYRRTSDLLCYNRKRLAELETQKEKPPGPRSTAGISGRARKNRSSLNTTISPLSTNRTFATTRALREKRYIPGFLSAATAAAPCLP